MKYKFEKGNTLRKKEIKYYINDKGCHICTSHISNNSNKYPRIQINKRRTKLHRYIWEINYGDIPKGLVVMHKCDNTQCINIEHLKLGTQADNVLDCKNKGRTNNVYTKLRKELERMKND